MRRRGKATVAAALLVGVAAVVLLAVLGYRTGRHEPAAGGSPSVSPSVTLPGSGTAPTRTTAAALPDGAKPLIRDGAPAPSGGADGPSAITPAAESDLFPDATGDVADDAAIWRNPDRPERSLVLADDKSDQGGVAVYTLDGHLLHYERLGQIGNIDLRDDIRIGDRAVTLVGANDRSRSTLRFWSLDATSGRLTAIEARPLPTISPNYGFCLGRDATGSRTYAFVSAEAAGGLEQYELRFSRGRVETTKVRTVDVGSQMEGCVVDDATGTVFVAEEAVGIWRYALDPATGARRTSVDRVDGSHLSSDVEGLALARGPDGRGVLIASSQGDSTYAVYDLDDGHAFRGSFQLRREGDVDGATETDGVAIAAGDFGPSFPNGLLVVHDGENHDAKGQDERCSNLKFARLDQVIALTPTA